MKFKYIIALLHWSITLRFSAQLILQCFTDAQRARIAIVYYHLVHSWWNSLRLAVGNKTSALAQWQRRFLEQVCALSQSESREQRAINVGKSYLGAHLEVG